MDTLQQFQHTAEEDFSEEAHIDAMAWKIYDIIYNRDPAPRPARSRKPSPRSFDDVESSRGRVKDLFDTLHLEA